jgi:hypothetical protein
MNGDPDVRAGIVVYEVHTFGSFYGMCYQDNRPDIDAVTAQEVAIRLLRQRFGDERDMAGSGVPAVHEYLDIQGSTPAHYNDRENRNEPPHP